MNRQLGQDFIWMTSKYMEKCSMSTVVVYSLSRVQLFVTPWTVTCQAPLSMGFFRPDYWSGLPLASPGDLPDPGIKPTSPALAGGFFTTEPLGKSIYCHSGISNQDHSEIPRCTYDNEKRKEKGVKTRNTYCWQVLIFLFVYCGKEHVTENLPLTSIFSTQSSGTGFPGGLDSKESACSVGDLCWIPGLGRSPGGGLGNPLQCSGLENPRGQRNMVGYSPWGRTESDTTEAT